MGLVQDGLKQLQAEKLAVISIAEAAMQSAQEEGI